jgi:hypothetical protein
VTYLEPDDFREGSFDEVCAQHLLTEAEAEDARLTATIARMSERIDAYCNDHFEPVNMTIRTAGTGTTSLILPLRTLAVTGVRFVDRYGVVGADEDTDAYIVKSSLGAAGTELIPGALDWLDAVVGGVGFSASPSYLWPMDVWGVEVEGTFGWASTPTDIKRAVALLTYNHFKPIRHDLGWSVTWRTEDASMDRAQTEPSGIPEVDEIVARYQRADVAVLVG